MNPKADVEPFKALMSGVFALYGREISATVLSIWWEAMRPFDLAGVQDALNRHAVDPDRGQFLPKPADVVRLIAGGGADAALLAWAKLERAVKEVGTYESVVFDDPILQRVAYDMGGWAWFGAQKDKEWPFVRQHFVNLYHAYRTRGRSVDAPRYLPGITEAENVRTGHARPAPRLVGDERLARLVLASGAALSSTPEVGSPG